MRKFKVIYGIGNGESEEIVECKSFNEAYKLGEEMAFDELDSMGGLHGYPCEEDYDSWEEYYEDSMSWLEVEIIEIKP